jgi:hypothetical protein
VDYVRVYHWDPNVGVAVAEARHGAKQATLTEKGGAVAVSLPYEQFYRCDVVSVSGKRVAFTTGTAKTFIVTTAGLAPGAYFVNVRGEFGTIRGRCAVQQ